MAIQYIVKVDDLTLDYYIKDILSHFCVDFNEPENYTDDIIVNIGGVDLKLRNNLSVSKDGIILITDTEIIMSNKSFVDYIKKTSRCVEFNSFTVLFRWLKLKTLLRK